MHAAESIRVVHKWYWDGKKWEVFEFCGRFLTRLRWALLQNLERQKLMVTQNVCWASGSQILKMEFTERRGRLLDMCSMIRSLG